jgi:UDP:flavonoid glycosyltransferase YjiC (YdhE family)
LRILFTTRPLAGHLQPLLPLAEAAAARGHAVAFGTGEPVLDEIRQRGFAAFEAGLPGPEARAEFLRRVPHLDEEPPEERRALFFSEAFAGIELGPRLADLEAVCAEWRPNILVHEAAELAGPVAASSAGLPYATAGFGLRIDPAILERAGEAAAPHWRERGLEPPPLAGLFRFIYLDPCPPSLQAHPPPPVTQPMRITPRPNPDPGGAAVWLRELPEHAAVYVTLGTTWNLDTELFRTLVDALETLPLAIVVTLGAGGDPASLGPRPGNVHIHRFIPQEEVLPFCRAVVHHGGSGSMLGAFAHGLPQLVIPQGADQFSNASRVAAVGAGLTLLPDQVSRGTVRPAVERLLAEPGFGAAARRVRDELDALPGPDRAVDRLEELVESPPPP